MMLFDRIFGGLGHFQYSFLVLFNDVVLPLNFIFVVALDLNLIFFQFQDVS